MEQRRLSGNSRYLPEPLSPSPMTHNGYDNSYEYYIPQRSPVPQYASERSPVPEYQQSLVQSPRLSASAPSPRVSAGSPPPPGLRIQQSPPTSNGGAKSHVEVSPTHFSEYHSPHPERVYAAEQAYNSPHALPADKEYYNKTSAYASVHPTPIQPAGSEPRKKPFYKRRICLVLALVVVAIAVVAVVCGVVLGRKRSTSTTSPTSPPTSTNTGDPELAVGGYLNTDYYSKKGAWNGSGIALAAANPGKDQTIYVFYQNFQGDITWKLVNPDRTLSQPLGTINPLSYKPLNGTPLSIVAHPQINDAVVYHLFYIDEKYHLRERVLKTGSTSGGSAQPIWINGPLSDKNLKTLESSSIGMQACLWNNFRGDWNVNYANATDGIHLWFATSETQFAQYSWSNGTSTWSQDKTWDGLDGHAGVACQTWDTNTTEYVWFVDKNQNIAMYWQDQNYNLTATTSHPISTWTKVNNINIPNVHRMSSLGYTSYMLYQDKEGVIRGVNAYWAAENTTLTRASDSSIDDFAIREYASSDPVKAIKGTHMAITVLKTPSGGFEVQVYLQTSGNDVTYYTRDRDRVHGTWQVAGIVVPD